MILISICRELQDGLLKENNLMDGSKIILIPNVETGLLVSKVIVFKFYRHFHDLY